jgi:hypothetical protein
MGDGSPGRAPTRTAHANPYSKRDSATSGEGEGYFLISIFSFLSLSQPQTEDGANVPFDVMNGERLLVADVAKIEYHR